MARRGAPINVAAAPRLTVDLLAGLYNFVTTLDTNGLNAVLPKNRDLTMQNVVGVQMLGWGLGLLFAPEWLTSNIMGGKVLTQSLRAS